MINYNKQKALGELLDVINKGISLLANEYLDKDLCQAYEKYVFSTIQLVDNAYQTNYAVEFSNSYLLFDTVSSTSYQKCLLNALSHINMPHSAKSVAQQHNEISSINYKKTLKDLLQKLIYVIKNLILV